VAGLAFPGLQRAVDESLVVQCAVLLGDMEDATALTADYVKVRKQFGAEIGSFQAVQHRLADMAIESSQARASVHLGLMALSTPGSDVSEAVSGSKAQLVRSAQFVTSQAIQLHGGYGITEEYKVGHHFRRLKVMEPVLGNGEYHLNRYARALQDAAR
jgi:alkylation response protein AidB-like acyl-CoA dehydrogenase